MLTRPEGHGSDFGFKSRRIPQVILMSGAARVFPVRRITPAMGQRLWTAEWAHVLDIRLAAVPSLAEGAPLVALASTAAQQAVRQRLVRTLRRHWFEGPAALRLAGLNGTVFPEPGFLAVLRQARSAMEDATLRDSAGRTNGSGDGRGRPRVPLAAAQTPRQTWLDFEQESLRAQLSRFHDAAVRTALRNRPAPERDGTSPASLPVALHPGASPVAIWHRVLPVADTSRQDFALPEPLEIFYSRLEGRGQPDKVRAHYRRQAGPKAEVHSTAQGLWLSGLRPADETWSWTSLDVLIPLLRKETSQKRTDVRTAGLQELTVEILLVRTGPRAAAASTAGEPPLQEEKPHPAVTDN